MRDLDVIYSKFIEKLKLVLRYILENFGEKEILMRKNQGLIQNRNFGIKNSQIKGYVFHGYGCDFRFKNEDVDIEFENDNIGFTDWSFYLFVDGHNSEITEAMCKAFLKEKVEKQELRFLNRIYEINE
ncbi:MULTISPECIES: DUF6896 domain-containing protein [Sphingobacterium]|uniref:DUF6896 domain-containing protein n=1 Tax=Sphingobacterium kitahiroshimense TaxID=470446 RepID=A0ABV0BZT9_9SPHI|nr:MULTISPECIES: hypothetical protein [unclassified Sphingobacterium]MBB2951677.1 hypothetical protein [Sphingobacterium sp. JUb56]MCS3557536.1 hypothetical protein [Sphingobacterium sp. JUb21]QQD13468.1 hypothetical protein JAZ75_23230 [Sphingobacterium sp. UDSM-2020]TCQ95921.1 hypothetical protein EDF66_12435 [Sphingobacterium sp. JUb20]